MRGLQRRVDLFAVGRVFVVLRILLEVAVRIIKRMSAQSFDLTKVDAIIRNDGSRDLLDAEVARVFRKLDLR